MADIAQAMRYKIDVKNGLLKQPMTGELMRGDKNANRIIVQLVDGSNDVQLDGVTVTGKFFRGGDGIEITLEGEANGNEATVLLDEHCYAVDGYFEASVKLTTGTQTRTILTITGSVVSDGEGGILDIENVVPSVADIVAQYQSMQEVTEKTKSATQAANTATSNANKAIANANTATGKANTAANAANTAAANANTAKDAANAAAGKINNMTVSATPVETGTATAELSTVGGNYHLALGLPKGDTGATPQISVQVQTGAAGSEASVSVSGTAENPVIHLTIPRGDVGNIGALTINGKAPDGSGAVTLKAADVGALATGGTSADSSKLGGKAPEYYLHPRNLLDNSDFTNLVAQAGIGGNHGTVAYAADRWILDSGTVSYTAGTGMTLNGTIRQKLEFQPTGQTSAFVGMVSGAASISYADGEVTITSGGGVIKWAALYEGSYTAETLPPYVPKGYAAELAECLRYYRALCTVRVAGNIIDSDGKAFAYIPCYVPMRKNPSIVTPSRVVVISNVGNKYSTDYDVYYGTSDESINGISLVTTFGSGVWTSNVNCTVVIENAALDADL